MKGRVVYYTPMIQTIRSVDGDGCLYTEGLVRIECDAKVTGEIEFGANSDITIDGDVEAESVILRRDSKLYITGNVKASLYLSPGSRVTINQSVDCKDNLHIQESSIVNILGGLVTYGPQIRIEDNVELVISGDMTIATSECGEIDIGSNSSVLIEGGVYSTESGIIVSRNVVNLGEDSKLKIMGTMALETNAYLLGSSTLIVQADCVIRSVLMMDSSSLSVDGNLKVSTLRSNNHCGISVGGRLSVNSLRIGYMNTISSQYTSVGGPCFFGNAVNIRGGKLLCESSLIVGDNSTIKLETIEVSSSCHFGANCVLSMAGKSTLKNAFTLGMSCKFESFDIDVTRREYNTTIGPNSYIKTRNMSLRGEANILDGSRVICVHLSSGSMQIGCGVILKADNVNIMRLTICSGSSTRVKNIRSNELTVLGSIKVAKNAKVTRVSMMPSSRLIVFGYLTCDTILSKGSKILVGGNMRASSLAFYGSRVYISHCLRTRHAYIGSGSIVLVDKHLFIRDLIIRSVPSESPLVEEIMRSIIKDAKNTVEKSKVKESSNQGSNEGSNQGSNEVVEVIEVKVKKKRKGNNKIVIEGDMSNTSLLVGGDTLIRGIFESCPRGLRVMGNIHCDDGLSEHPLVSCGNIIVETISSLEDKVNRLMSYQKGLCVSPPK